MDAALTTRERVVLAVDEFVNRDQSLKKEAKITQKMIYTKYKVPRTSFTDELKRRKEGVIAKKVGRPFALSENNRQMVLAEVKGNSYSFDEFGRLLSKYGNYASEDNVPSYSQILREVDMLGKTAEVQLVKPRNTDKKHYEAIQDEDAFRIWYLFFIIY